VEHKTADNEGNRRQDNIDE